MFYDCWSLTNVTIPNSVTVIGSGAFQRCFGLTSVTIGNSVTVIGSQAFYDCESLTSVTIPNSVTSIGSYAFYLCTSLTSVTIGNSVTSIGDGAFYYCPSLTNVTIPNSVTSIGDHAFYACNALTNLMIGSSVTNIGGGAFSSCTSLTAITVDALNSVYSSVAGVLFNKSTNTLVAYPGGKAGSYTIPNSVTNIGIDAFYNCLSLTSVTIPNSVTSIGDYAFAGCSLTNVTIPNSVTSIGDYAFYGCTSLTGLYFQGNAPSLGSSVFYSDNNATVYYLPGTTGWENFAQITGLPTVLWDTSPTIITASPLPAGVVGTAYSMNLAAIGSTSPYIWSLAAGNLPAGLSLSTNGVISGTPGLVTNVSFTVQVVGGNGLSTNKAFGLTIVSDPLATALDGPGLAWTTGGNVPWFAQTTTTHDGVDAAQSGQITDDQESWMQTTLTGPGTLTYWRKVSSESGYDFLEFYLDGVLQSGSISGEVGWQKQANNIPDGAHTVKWRYMKDESDSSGQDAGWVDEVSYISSRPSIITTNGSLGISNGLFGFTVSGPASQTNVVEASTNLLDWKPLKTNVMGGSPVYFSDPDWTNYPGRFYRLRSP